MNPSLIPGGLHAVRDRLILNHVIPSLVLAGVLLLLWIPFLGKFLSHLLLHALIHRMDHSERFSAGLDVVLWGLVLAVPACAALGYWWGVLQAVLGLLIVWRVFTAH